MLAIWAFWLEPSSLRVSHYDEYLQGWPKACDGLKIAVLADLHVGSPFNGIDQLAEVVTQTNRAKPDLVLLAGDYVIQDVVGGRFVAPEVAANELAKLKASAGIFAVLGNHDWWLDAARVETALSTVGIKVLKDRNVQVDSKGCQFTLAGISDYWEGGHDITQALSGHPTALPVIAFSHNPDIIPKLPDEVDYFLAGHTHGGQVNLPFVGRIVVPSSFGQRYAAGPINENSRRAFVSTGIGTSILPVRFRVPPEISIVQLRTAKN